MRYIWLGAKKRKFELKKGREESGVMEKLINKNGIEVQNSAKHVFEELMRGTGCVMADKSSIFVENQSINEKYIVVSRVPESTGSVMEKKFLSSQFKEAWEFFTNKSEIH